MQYIHFIDTNINSDNDSDDNNFVDSNFIILYILLILILIVIMIVMITTLLDSNFLSHLSAFGMQQSFCRYAKLDIVVNATHDRIHVRSLTYMLTVCKSMDSCFMLTSY